MRYFFEISYFGGNHHGWQNQVNAMSIQQEMEDALSKRLRTKIQIVGSGRTDTGVHCVQQFFHTDIEMAFQKEDLLHELNSLLSPEIAIRSIRSVKPNAHARYDALSRTYLYRITTKKNPLTIGQTFQYFKSLDIERMNAAAACIVGKHEFTSFSKVKTDVSHFFCDVKKCTWKKVADEIQCTITANRFLRGMVRALVGTMIDVGIEKISTTDFIRILNSHDRRKAGMNVPAHGLYLVEVKYPKTIFL